MRGKRNEVPRQEVHGTEGHSGGPAGPAGEYWPTGCEAHVNALRERIRGLTQQAEYLQERNDSLSTRLAKCYATRPAIRTASDVALRVLADRVLEEVTTALESEGWSVVRDVPDDEEEQVDHDQQEEG